MNKEFIDDINNSRFKKYLSNEFSSLVKLCVDISRCNEISFIRKLNAYCELAGLSYDYEKLYSQMKFYRGMVYHYADDIRRRFDSFFNQSEFIVCMCDKYPIEVNISDYQFERCLEKAMEIAKKHSIKEFWIYGTDIINGSPYYDAVKINEQGIICDFGTLEYEESEDGELSYAKAHSASIFSKELFIQTNFKETEQ